MEVLSQDTSHPLKDTLVCHQDMPFRCRKLDYPISDAELLSIYADNQRLMEVIINSDDTHLDSEQAMDRDAIKEIRRLELKINLLMGWVGSVMKQQQQIPDHQEIVLSAKGLKFSTNADLLLNDELLLELFIEPRYPQAFVTLATVIEINSNPDDEAANAAANAANNSVIVRFTDESEMNRQWLDKFVFRLHRRQVAFSRQRK